MSSDQAWRCPLCAALAESGPEHLRQEHGLGRPTEDRFGLRRALPEEPVPLRRRPGPGRRAQRPDPEPEPPPRPAPLPPDAAILRLVCESLDGRDAGSLQSNLAALHGVEAAAVDLYAGTVDLFLDRGGATATHLVAMATERFRLPVVGAELHRRPAAGTGLGDATRIGVLL